MPTECQPENDKPRAVIFDVFGTLLQIGEAHHPYRQLMQLLRAQGRQPQAGDARTILTFAGSLTELALHLGGTGLSFEDLRDCEAALARDLAGIHHYPDAEEAIMRVRQAGLMVGLCSNLAQPYGGRVMQLLVGLDCYAMSYAVGSIKPEGAIYEHVLRAFQLPATSCLFIGDSQVADQEGPRAIGMDGRLLERHKGQSLLDLLRDIRPAGGSTSSTCAG